MRVVRAWLRALVVVQARVHGGAGERARAVVPDLDLTHRRLQLRGIVRRGHWATLAALSYIVGVVVGTAGVVRAQAAYGDTGAIIVFSVVVVLTSAASLGCLWLASRGDRS